MSGWLGSRRVAVMTRPFDGTSKSSVTTACRIRTAYSTQRSCWGAASIRDEVQLSAGTGARRTTERPNDQREAANAAYRRRNLIISRGSPPPAASRPSPSGGLRPALTRPLMPGLKRHRMPNENGAQQIFGDDDHDHRCRGVRTDWRGVAPAFVADAAQRLHLQQLTAWPPRRRVGAAETSA
jgi:hypothetical protein